MRARRSFRLPALSALLALLGLLGLLAVAGPARAASGRQADTRPGISVEGSHLMQNGQPFVPRGVQIVGLVAPDSQLWGKYIAAHQHFGSAELQRAIADHANLVRFQVSQFGLNPADPEYDPSYVNEVIQGVELARSLGLDVIVSLQAQAPAGSEVRCPLPDAGAATDWREIAQWFAGDPDIMFELYNEPGVPNTHDGRQSWKNGGIVHNGNGPCAAVGMQTLVDEIRAAGAPNVIIVPSVAGETTLAFHPKITDPANPGDAQLAWGIHYPNLTQTPDEWSNEFGKAAGHRPVVVTEWQANGTTNCIPDAPRVAPRLLDYLALKQIGIVGFSFDLPGTIVADYAYTPTTYANWSCGSFTGGAGQTLFDDYAGEAAQASVSGQGAPASWLLTVPQLEQMSALDAATAGQALNTPRTFVLGASSPQLQAAGLGAASGAIAFTSETTLARSVAQDDLPQGTSAVMLDLGPGSPLSQQRQPAATFALAYQAAQRNGLLFIAAPQIGIVRALAPHSRRRDWNIIFLRRRVAAAAAANADALVLPFGGAQAHTSGYAAIARIASDQANAVNAGIQLIGGLRVGGANTPAGTTLAATARAASRVLTGFSLNGRPAATNAAPITLLQQLYDAGA